jgi:catechol 2,3-dioxygenase-like lactoylglutathione lyase family enzyme
MKRFHVHAHVADLGASIAFYSKLFGAEPTRVEADYAKWMLDDPRINFAISARGAAPGVDHLGFQADDAAELAELKARAQAADMALLDEGQTTCCYARSDKHWVTDPQGIAWEHFHSLENIPVFREAAPAPGAACCAQAPGTAAAAGATSASAAGTTGCGQAAAGQGDAPAPAAACCGPSPAAVPAPKAAARCC